MVSALLLEEPGGAAVGLSLNRPVIKIKTHNWCAETLIKAYYELEGYPLESTTPTRPWESSRIRTRSTP